MQGAEHVDNQPSAGAATLLVVPEEGHHCRESDAARTQVHGPLVEVKPLRPASVYCCLWSTQYSVLAEGTAMAVARTREEGSSSSRTGS